MSTPNRLAMEIDRFKIYENAGPGAATGTVSRDFSASNRDQSLVVNLSSSDPGEAAVQAKVTIPAGELSANFPIDAVDDTLRDGVKEVAITASATGFESGSATLEVTGECDLVVVTETNMNGWVALDVNFPAGQLSSETTFVVGPAPPPLGACSVRLETGPGIGKMGDIGLGGKPALILPTPSLPRLASLQALSYSTYVSSS
ncbi:MAG: hypothetical protein HYU36_22580, partial [Planctomycetes bacterium]|nr:hypothetical protein [Planctomycetota bacterium]